MAVANAVSIVPSRCCICRTQRSCDEDHKVWILGLIGETCRVVNRFPVGLNPKRNHNVVGAKWKLNALETRIADNTQTKSTTEIPATCYQLIGVSDRAEKDEIVKAVMDLKNSEIEEGYTMDVVVSRQELLMDVRDKLLFEPEYAGNVKEKIMPKSSFRLSLSWLPAALCLLQEVGELKLVLDIGQTAIPNPEYKPYIHDLLLSLALAECAIAKIGFEKNKVCHGFEALARAQRLLRSKASLESLTLLSQIEDSLEELAPACTLELLGLPHFPETADRRQGAIAALRELLRQGLDVETSCQVQDWPWFLSQALNRLMASEIIDLLPWDSLAMTRKNKKSLESQNQRIIIDTICFYRTLMAHLAFGFSSKDTDLINRAKIIIECLVASEGIDLKLEEALCLFLLGQGTEADVMEKLKLLQINSSTKHKLISGKAVPDASPAKLSLEIWLKDELLALFPDTKDSSPSVVNFFSSEKKTIGTRRSKEYQQNLPTICRRPLSSSILSERTDYENPNSGIKPSQNLRFSVKQLAPTDLQSSLLSGQNDNSSSDIEPSVPLKRNIGNHCQKFSDYLFGYKDLVGRISFITVFGCILFSALKLSGMNLIKIRTGFPKAFSRSSNTYRSSLPCASNSADFSRRPTYIKKSSISDRLKKLVAVIKMQSMKHPDTINPSNLCSAASLISSMTHVYRRQMPIEEAEILVNEWQNIKAEALGSSHQAYTLSEVLDESMLVQWQALADAARDRSCHWRFVLLGLSVLRADIFVDEVGAEMAEIEALLEEAAELVDESQSKNPNYYSTYKVRYVLKRQEEGLWRFCQSDVQSI